MSPRIRLPDELSGEPFAVGHALELGMSAKRLRGSDLDRPFWGVRAPRDAAATLTGLAGAYATRMPAGAFFSHVTAALLWGIPLPRRLAGVPGLDVSVPVGRAVPTGRTIRGHRLHIDEVDVVTLDGLPRTSLARTWCDLAALLSEEELIAAGDFLIWRRRPPSLRLDRQLLSDALSRFDGSRGRPALDAALLELTDRADSPPESTMRVRFMRAGLPECTANPMLYTESGSFIGMPDLAFLEYRVAYDYEGDHHRTDPVQWQKDLRRGIRFEDADWSYVRGGAPDLRDSREVIDLLSRRLRERGWQSR